MLIVRDRAFYRTMLTIALPSAFQGLLSQLNTYLDDIMVSKIVRAGVDNFGDIALAGVGQTNSLTAFFTAAVLGLTSGSSVLIAQYWGKHDTKKIKQVFPIVVTLCLLVSLLFILLARVWPRQILGIVLSAAGNGSGATDAAVSYFTIVCFSYLPYALSASLTGMLRAVEIVRVTLYISLSSSVVNLLFNYLLIFGHLGFPAMGVEGAAVATIITRVVELAIVWLYTFRVQKRLDIRPRDLLHAPREMWRDYRKYSLPIGIGDMQWSLVGLGKAAIIGHLATEVISANRAAEALMSLGMIFTSSLAAGACIVIGKTVGEKDYEKTRRYSVTIQLLFAVFGLFMAAIVYWVRIPFMSTYGLSDTARSYAVQMAALGALTLIGTTYHASCFVGINRGAGDGKFVMIVDMLCGWLIVLPLAYLAAHVWRLSPPLVFLFIRIDQCFKWLIAFIRLRGNRWIKNVTRE